MTDFARAETQLPRAAERAARAWTEAYATISYRDSMRDVLRDIRPYSSRALRDEMSTNSGSLTLVAERRDLKYEASAEAVAVYQHDESANSSPLVVVYELTTTTREGRTRELRTITLGLERISRAWKVAGVLVP